MFDIAARKSLYLKGRTSALLPRHPLALRSVKFVVVSVDDSVPVLGGLRSL